MEFYAHISEDGKLEPVSEHLKNTAVLASGYSKSFGAQDQAYYIGLMHDIGKYSEEFQNRLLGGRKVDHSTAGAYECAKKGQVPAAFCIAGHHSGIPDRGNRSDLDEGTLIGRLNRAKDHKIADYSCWERYISVPNVELPVRQIKDAQEGYIYCKMLFSCLVDADYLSTESFMKGTGRSSSGTYNFTVLKEKLNQYISGWFPPGSQLNRCRCSILQNCIEKASHEKGLFTLTVPTGGGKTVASLAFALNHAEKHGMSRIIYVIPYTSIIEQTADIFRNILDSENVLEHHSNALNELDFNKDFDKETLINATENWDAPVVVTTAVQFFESVFSNKPSKSRKLHNISNSVIVFDEAQMIPVPFVRPCIYAISQLLRFYGITAVLCTATQPALDKLFKLYMGEKSYHQEELCPEDMFRNHIFDRTQYKSAGLLTWEQVAEKMNSSKQALCIVNSRKNARKLYDLLEGENIFHLSTLMTPASRRQKLSEIRRLLKEGKECRLVSTSLIEAGVDIDFPFVMRQEAGIDSVLQSGGRCNREGKRSKDESVVLVFKTEDKCPEVFLQNISAARLTMHSYADFTTSEAIHFYYSELLDLKGEKGQDRENILALIDKQAFKTIAERFHLIDNNTFTVYIPQDQTSSELIDQLKQGVLSRELFRKLTPYAVNIYEDNLKGLYESGDVIAVKDGVFCLTNTDLYDMACGLSLEADWGKAEFI